MSSAYATLAERYARAIFELGVESGNADGLVNEIGDFSAVYAQSSDLSRVLENPRVLATEREAVLREISNRLGLSPLALNAVRYVASRRRLRALPEIARRLGQLADEQRGVVRASVTTAGPLPEAFFERLTRELETMTGKRVALERREDPSLIAGVVTRIGDNTVDGSLRGRLEHIERGLLA